MVDEADLERVRLTWQYVEAQVDLKKQYYVQLFIASVTLSASGLLAVVFEKVTPPTGLAISALMLSGAIYAQVQLRRLMKALQDALAGNGPTDNLEGGARPMTIDMRTKSPKVLATDEEVKDFADRVARSHPDWYLYRPGEPHRVVKWYHWLIGLKD